MLNEFLFCGTLKFYPELLSSLISCTTVSNTIFFPPAQRYILDLVQENACSLLGATRNSVLARNDALCR